MDFSEVVARRHMVRDYRADPVDPEALHRVLDAARRVPSAGNTQGTELLVLVGPTETRRYWDTTLPESRRDAFRWPGLLVAPVLVLPCVSAGSYVERYAEADKAGTDLGAGADRWSVPYWCVDGGMSVLAILLAAVDEGLGALFFGLFDHEDAVRAAFGIPSERQPLGAIALGHPVPGEPGRSATRRRRSLDELVHRGHW